MGLTRKQSECFKFIADRINDSGLSPTLEEIAAHINVHSRGAAHRTVEQIIQRDYLRRIPNRARSLQVVASPGAVHLNPEICSQVDDYAIQHRIARDTAVNELLRLQLGLAA